jgi:protein-L-isoaspartate(D-aspartate) O-methyltransferase
MKHVSVESAYARSLRETLVRELEILGDVSTPSVVEAMRLVPREDFIGGVCLETAYANVSLELGGGQGSFRPSFVGRMVEALALVGHERVLEIGTGSGYQAAVLSLLCRQVFCAEPDESAAMRASCRLAELGYANAHVRAGDGHRVWLEEAPFDRILVNSETPRIPRTLVHQLAEGGILVVPVDERDGTRSLVRVSRRRGELVVADLGPSSVATGR